MLVKHKMEISSQSNQSRRASILFYTWASECRYVSNMSNLSNFILSKRSEALGVFFSARTISSLFKDPNSEYRLGRQVPMRRHPISFAGTLRSNDYGKL